ncbi:magnesium and cobalt transport protein CorA [Ochrobactrum sp. SFR4]|uniref:magnesium and cobalt transport protein CorA n=1 Tax=Ochrobactrum sp. SFR4 TaxID=2717368 RepID=UPI001C8C8CD3|nr:magnesium and cobalt transport protein CorA [Ochrobactrum sp. SFR4]MBX8827429.1 magnesium and cobalt transport protein CorA [Ochrobactrum sp. SFR4]
MTIDTAFQYQNGKRIGTISVGENVSAAPDDFVWIALSEPTHEEITLLATTYNLHRLAVEDALTSRRAPKVEVFGNELLVIVNTAQLEGDDIKYGQIAIFVGPAHVITVRHGANSVHEEAMCRFDASNALLKSSPGAALHAVFDVTVDGFLPLVEAIEDKVLEMEAQMLESGLTRDQVRRLFKLRRELILFQRVLGPTSQVAARLVDLVDLSCMDGDTTPYFRDVTDHLHRLDNVVDGLWEVVTSVFEVSNLLEQQRQNAISRQLAAWAAIIAVPTAVAGIYGMNFQNMPELATEYGYYVVLAAILVICLTLYCRFRKSGWL